MLRDLIVLPNRLIVKFERLGQSPHYLFLAALHHPLPMQSILLNPLKPTLPYPIKNFKSLPAAARATPCGGVPGRRGGNTRDE